MITIVQVAIDAHFECELSCAFVADLEECLVIGLGHGSLCKRDDACAIDELEVEFVKQDTVCHDFDIFELDQMTVGRVVIDIDLMADG